MAEEKVKTRPDLEVGIYKITKGDGAFVISKNGEAPGRFTEESFEAVVGLYYESNF